MRSRSTGMWWGAAIEAPDPAALAAFYSRLLGWPVAHEEPGTAILKPQDSVFLVFQLAEDYVPPVWPPAVLPVPRRRSLTPRGQASSTEARGGMGGAGPPI